MLTSSLAMSTAQAATANTKNDRDTTARFMSSISEDGLVAVVNESPILKSDLKRTIKLIASKYKKLGMPLPSAKKLQNEALNELILRELQLNLVKRSGIRPSDAVINAQLAKYAQSQGLSSITALQQKMDAKQAGSYAALRNNIINELSIQGIRQNQIAKRVRISEQDVNSFLASPEGKKLNQNEYLTVHIRVPYPDDYNELSNSRQKMARQEALKIASRVQNDLRLQYNNDQESILLMMSKLQGDYPVQLQGGNMGYNPANQLPANLTNDIVNLDINEVSEPIIGSNGVDIIKLVNKKVSSNLIVPQWHTRHILISVNDLQNNQLAQLKINDLYEQLRAGADFAKLAATYSDDPGSAGKGGDLDWVSEGSMVPEFENVMKKTMKGDFSVPFKSQYGWHILQVVDTRDYDASNEVRKGMAKDILFKRMAPQAQEDWLEELKSRAYIRVFNF